MDRYGGDAGLRHKIRRALAERHAQYIFRGTTMQMLRSHRVFLGRALLAAIALTLTSFVATPADAQVTAFKQAVAEAAADAGVPQLGDVGRIGHGRSRSRRAASRLPNRESRRGT